MDVERVAARRLSAATGIRAVLEVPDDRPEEFLSVELTGGFGDYLGVAHECQLAVQAWAGTRERAASMARRLEQAAYLLDEEPNIFAPSVSALYRFPDPDSGQERYQLTVELTVCE